MDTKNCVVAKKLKLQRTKKSSAKNNSNSSSQIQQHQFSLFVLENPELYSMFTLLLFIQREEKKKKNCIPQF